MSTESESMVKSELVKIITANQKNLNHNDISSVIELILEKMTEALCEGTRIEIRGFGSFSLHEHEPRKAHNPRTGEIVYTEKKRVPHFKPGKELRERVNTGGGSQKSSVPGTHDDEMV